MLWMVLQTVNKLFHLQFTLAYLVYSCEHWESEKTNTVIFKLTCNN